MRLAVLADVHGNLEALEAVLSDVDRQAPDASVVVAGDVVGYGPDPNACIELLRARGAAVVLGNHEEMVLGLRDFSRCVYAGIVAALWTRRHLSPENEAYLRSLSPSLEVAPGVIAAHGDLGSTDTYVSTGPLARAALERLGVRYPNARVLLLGHTHHSMLFTTSRGAIRGAAGARFALGNGPALINPGAVGQARDELVLARWACLDLDGGLVSYRALAYDQHRTLEKLGRAGLVARVTLPPPRGLARHIERLRTRLARRRAERKPHCP
jgi:predicted phosphodiesterase